MASAQREIGLKLGLIVMAAVTVLLCGLLVFGPRDEAALTSPAIADAQETLLDRLSDAPTGRAITALKITAPGTVAELETLTHAAIVEGASQQALSELVLEALFAQFRAQAGSVKGASSDDFQSIVRDLRTGLEQLKARNSQWCKGETIAAFLAQNESELVPSLLSEFPYGSPQYDWAMDWMTTILTVAKQGQDRRLGHARPGFRDEAILQQTGLALGSEQWALGIQIAAFSNSEGTSYAQMQEVIAGMNVCDLGIAVETVSARLPDDVRARIWADLMPEIMVGNTPYVMYRVNDYFFIG